MLQSSSVSAATEEHVLKILRIKITRARAFQDIPARNAKLVSSRVTFL